MYLIPLALLIGAAVGLFVRGSFDYLLATRVGFWPRGALSHFANRDFYGFDSGYMCDEPASHRSIGGPFRDGT